MQTHFLSWGKEEVRLNYEQVDIWGTYGAKKLDLSTHLMEKQDQNLIIARGKFFFSVELALRT